MESFLSGHLLPDEITPELMLAAWEHLQKIKKNQRDRVAEKLRHSRVEKAACVIDLKGANIFIEPGLKVANLRSYAVFPVRRRPDANFFVVQDPAIVSSKIRFAAGLNGCALVTMEFLKSNAARGHVWHIALRCTQLDMSM